ncbi:MAG: hypothetical protein IJ618_03040, partial [Prevotella sp.]|nr:hypothetical protein [Prevotella sp.]
RRGDGEHGERKGGYKSSQNRGGHERFDRSGKDRSFGKEKTTGRRAMLGKGRAGRNEDFGKKRRFDDDED